MKQTLVLRDKKNALKLSHPSRNSVLNGVISRRMLVDIFWDLFHLDVDLRDATVFQTLKLTEGGGATEAVAARGDAVMIEEI